MRDIASPCYRVSFRSTFQVIYFRNVKFRIVISQSCAVIGLRVVVPILLVFEGRVCHLLLKSFPDSKSLPSLVQTTDPIQCRQWRSDHDI